MKKVFCVVAHCDDEILGAGGTLAKHAAAGDLVHIMVLAGKGSAPGMRTDAQKACLEAASQVIGADIVTVLDFEDQQFDIYPLIHIVQAIEKEIAASCPEIVYTHHAGDLNLDHRITHQAVLTACRPLPGSSVKAIYGMEIPSSTEWGTPFVPTHFVHLSGNDMDKKEDALRCYINEMREEPHARSFKRIEALALWRGGEVGVQWAEAFTTIRTVS